MSALIDTESLVVISGFHQDKSAEEVGMGTFLRLIRLPGYIHYKLNPPVEYLISSLHKAW